MRFFHDFTIPLRELFGGNLLMWGCSLFYLAWWVLTFRPDAAAGASGGKAGTVCLVAAFGTGIAALCGMVSAIRSLAADSAGLPVRFILIGAAVSYLLLLVITVTVYRRPVTSELLIMHIWAAVELAAVAVLAGTGRFGPGTAAALALLVGAATAAGVVCYILYYRLGGTASFQDGAVPLAADALVMTVFLCAQALS